MPPSTPFIFLYKVVLLVFLVQPDIQYQSHNHRTERAKLHSINVIPTQNMAKNQHYSGKDDDDDAQMFQKSIHIAIYFLVYPH